MKFLIKSLGWERFKEEFDRELAGVRAEGGKPLPFDPDTLPVEQPPAQRDDGADGARDGARARARRRCTGPASCRT